MAEYGLSSALTSIEPSPRAADPPAKLRAQLRLDETRETGQGIMGMLADWFRWRTRPDPSQSFDPMQPISEQPGFDPTDIPFQPGGVASKLGKVTGAMRSGTPLSDILGSVETAFPALMAKVRSAPRTIDVQAGSLLEEFAPLFTGSSDRAGKVLGAYVPGKGKKWGNTGIVHVNDTGTSPFKTLLHELIHTRNEAYPPSARLLKSADRSLPSSDRHILAEGYAKRKGQTAEGTQEEAYTRALTNRLMRRARLVPELEESNSIVGPAIQAEPAGQAPDFPKFSDWWMTKELYRQHPNPAPAQVKAIRELLYNKLLQ